MRKNACFAVKNLDYPPRYWQFGESFTSPSAIAATNGLVPLAGNAIIRALISTSASPLFSGREQWHEHKRSALLDIVYSAWAAHQLSVADTPTLHSTVTR